MKYTCLFACTSISSGLTRAHHEVWTSQPPALIYFVIQIARLWVDFNSKKVDAGWVIYRFGHANGLTLNWILLITVFFMRSFKYLCGGRMWYWTALHLTMDFASKQWCLIRSYISKLHSPGGSHHRLLRFKFSREENGLDFDFEFQIQKKNRNQAGPTKRPTRAPQKRRQLNGERMRGRWGQGRGAAIARGGGSRALKIHCVHKHLTCPPCPPHPLIFFKIFFN